MIALCSLAQPGLAQSMDHTAHTRAIVSSERNGPGEVGQSAFAALQETVARLMADPETDWTRVNIDALRDHLVDMDRVTMRARVETQGLGMGLATGLATDLATGARFFVRSDVPEVVASIKRMVPAHAAVMTGHRDWRFAAEPLEDGAILTVTGAQDDAAQIRGLGFFGVLSMGMHHPTHHLAMARGMDPHNH
jgi:hypothetical protein